MQLKIISINISNPSLNRAKQQCTWLSEKNYDIIILSEVKNSEGCNYIEKFFKDGCAGKAKYSVTFPKSIHNERGVMIISKYKPIKISSIFNRDDILYNRYVECKFEIRKRTFNLIGIYVPSRDRSEKKILKKETFINCVITKLKSLPDQNYILTGDLNILDKMHTPHYSTFFRWEYDFYDSILDSRFTDSFISCNPKLCDYSWVGRTGNGYRYDYFFVSQDWNCKVINCTFIHETREIKLTDHSAIELIIDI